MIENKLYTVYNRLDRDFRYEFDGSSWFTEIYNPVGVSRRLQFECGAHPDLTGDENLVWSALMCIANRSGHVLLGREHLAAALGINRRIDTVLRSLDRKGLIDVSGHFGGTFVSVDAPGEDRPEDEWPFTENWEPMVREVAV